MADDNILAENEFDVSLNGQSFVISFLNTVKSGLQRNLMERELFLRASGLDYTIVRAPILTSAPAGQTNIRITPAVHRLTAGPKISRGDLARVMILASEHLVASRKTFDLLAERGVAPSDQQLLDQLEQIPA